MSVPRFRSVAAAFASRRFEEVGFRKRRSTRVAVPRFRRKAEAFVFPLGRFETNANVRSSPPGGRSESRSSPGTIALAVRRPGQARSAFRQERVEIEGEPRDPTAPSSRTWHRSELRSFRSPDRRWEANSPLDPFAASNRGKPRSLRCRTSHEQQAPRPPSFAAPSGSKLPSLAAGPSSKARTLRIEARRQHRPEANLLPLPPGQPPGASPEPRPFAASIRSKLRSRPPERMRTEIPARPVSRAFQIEPKSHPSNRRI